MERVTAVEDEAGVRYDLFRKLGAGGQGEVWLASGGRRIVKLMSGRRRAEALRRRFAAVKRMDIGDLHVAKPLSVLRPPHVGYVAEFLDDMVPVSELLSPPDEGSLEWHIETGGLRRRLRLLAHAGEVLASLHARGIIYADISPHNVFVSEPVHALEAWLIDLDNLSHHSDASRTVYTPGYGAPEIVRGVAGNTSLSDAHSFACLVWQVLTLNHPLIGDYVNDGEPELEERAFAGELPWVASSTDEMNVATAGLPWELTMGRRLFDLARRTFEGGLTDRTQRPGIAAWVELLHATADQCVGCPDCAGSYLVTEEGCPWCGHAKARVVPGRFALWSPANGMVRTPTKLPRLAVGCEEIELTRRLTGPLSGPRSREVAATLEAVPRGVRVRARPDAKVWVAERRSPLKTAVAVDGRGKVIPDRGWMVFFENRDQTQRVLLLGGSR